MEWQKGKKKDGSDSVAKQIANENYWSDFRIIACITSKKEKKIKSRAGMEQTILTSPFYDAWLKTIDKDLKEVKDGIAKKDFSKVGRIAEENCLKMHSLMISTKPSIIYWNKGTIEVIHNVFGLREKGIECYFTIDAGPQVKILCLQKNLKTIINTISKIKTVKSTIVSKTGKGVINTNNHLF